SRMQNHKICNAARNKPCLPKFLTPIITLKEAPYENSLVTACRRNGICSAKSGCKPRPQSADAARRHKCWTGESFANAGGYNAARQDVRSTQDVRRIIKRKATAQGKSYPVGIHQRNGHA